MKFIYMILVLAILMPGQANAAVKITEEQFKDIDIIHEVIKERYPQFKGFSGSKDNLNVIGLSDETVEMEIKRIDIPKIKRERENAKKLKRDKVLNKFKSLGFSEEDIKTLGL